MDRRAFSRAVIAIPLASAPAFAATQPSEAPGIGPQVRTFTHVGKEEQPFLSSTEAQLAFQEGTGYLNHMWFGGSFPNFNNLRIRIYVDGEKTPSIDMELGLAIGVGFQDQAAPWGTAFSGITGAPSGMFLNHRIPFSKSLRVTAQLPNGVDRETPFWWIIRGLQNHSLEECGFTLPPHTRLRLHRREEIHVQPLDEFDLARVQRAGLLFQVTMAARSSNFEFMEGQMRAYIDGAATVQFLSSGLEDYFLGTYYFNRGLYHLPTAGLTHKDETNYSFSAYRYHHQDPVVFSREMRLTCRCGDQRANKTFGTTGHPQPTTYTTYAWIYEW